MSEDASTCRYCQASIYWALHHDTRKPMPFDAQTDPSLDKGWSLRKRQSTGEVLAVYMRDAKGVPLRRPHFETCPNFKRKPPADGLGEGKGANQARAYAAVVRGGAA